MNTYKIQINNKIQSVEDIQQKLKNENLLKWEKTIYEFILNWFDQSEYILQQTSGSTGTPKIIKLKKSAMVFSAQKTISIFKLNENNSAWLCLPINYIAGKMMVVRAIIGNLNLIITEPKGTLKIPDQKIDFSAMVPLQVQKLIESNTNFKTIKKLIIGGAATNASLLEKIQHLPSEVYASYGMTETCSHIAIKRLNGVNPDKYFKVLDGISISINSENCLIIHAPELSHKAIETTDMVEIISPHEFELIGRADNIINSGGIKISPEVIETEISQHFGFECLIVPVPDTKLGQKMVLVVEKEKDRFLAKSDFEFIRIMFGSYRSPKEVVYIDSFPRNKALKIDRKKVIQKVLLMYL